MPTLVYTATEGTAPSPVELSTPSQNVVRPVIQDLAAVVALLGGPLGTMKGVAVNGVAGVLQDLNGNQQAACWRRGPQLGIDNLSGVVDLDLNIAPGVPVNLIRLRTTANCTLRSMNSNVNDPQNQEIVIVHERQSGGGFLTIPHNMAGALFAPFFNANLKSKVLGNACAYLARGISGFWRSNDQTASTVTLVVPVPALAAATTGVVDVSLVGTPLEGTPASAIVSVSPQSDLAISGLNFGYFIGARMSGTNTLRFQFVGTLAGGNANFSVATL